MVYSPGAFGKFVRISIAYLRALPPYHILQRSGIGGAFHLHYKSTKFIPNCQISRSVACEFLLTKTTFFCLYFNPYVLPSQRPSMSLPFVASDHAID